MMKWLGMAAILALASGIACADTIMLAGGESFTNMPASVLDPAVGTNCGLTTNCGSVGGPYWDNTSGGSAPEQNAGFFLTAQGAFAGGTDYDPLTYLAGSGSPDAPTSITLDSTSVASATLLLNDTGYTGTTFGYYNESDPADQTVLFGPGALTGDIGDSVALSSLTNGENYGFFITRCLVWVSGYSGPCSEYTTWYSDESLDTTDTGHQHFVIFTSPTTGDYYIGLSDWLQGNSGEGNGDFSNILIELNSTVPEPATFGLIGAGLLGLGLTRLRARKRRV